MFGINLKIKSDEELMLMISNGHERAFTTLYERYSRPLLRYFFRMLWKDEDKAQDFLHDLFVKIIERPEYFDTSKKFSTWIYSVAHNMCKNEYRKHAFRQSAQSEITNAESVESTAPATLDAQHFATALEKAMQVWQEEDKSLFVLRHELDMTFTEIGTVLNCPEGTAKSRWFYLRKELAGQLSGFKSMIG
ncbi:MAG TPA: sigma-70 family RNA polymerase sigma factor [Chryseosolibacter sp.]|nr:sigma-70 family RNA polymerase sigma factor [Chryseosolibacter sp.]